MMTWISKPKSHKTKIRKIKISKTTCYRVVPVWLIGKHGKIPEVGNIIFFWISYQINIMAKKMIYYHFDINFLKMISK
jgi:hypothetical protein